MNKVTISVSIAMLLTAIFMTTSVSASAEKSLETEALQVITQGSGFTHPRFVRVEKTERGLWVRGQLKKSTHSLWRNRDHVDLEFVDRDDKVLLTKAISLSPVWWKKSRHTRWFSKIINEFPTESKLVRVKSHRGDTQHN